ncbi:MAG: hypothetical protein Q3M30_12255 [Candidatus Electrothrix sp. Rat3]|nr:hypothetical protein [Candidatus Electrothrix rattekaaiensis]
MDKESKCPVTGKTLGDATGKGTTNQLNLRILHLNSPLIDPMDEGFVSIRYPYGSPISGNCHSIYFWRTA